MSTDNFDTASARSWTLNGSIVVGERRGRLTAAFFIHAG